MQNVDNRLGYLLNRNANGREGSTAINTAALEAARAENPRGNINFDQGLAEAYCEKLDLQMIAIPIVTMVIYLLKRKLHGPGVTEKVMSAINSANFIVFMVDWFGQRASFPEGREAYWDKFNQAMEIGISSLGR